MLKNAADKVNQSMSNKVITREYFERKECEKIFQQQIGRCEARKKELKNENRKHRKKGIRLKFTEAERQLNKEFAAEILRNEKELKMIRIFKSGWRLRSVTSLEIKCV